VLTTIHQYGSQSPFQRNETKFGPGLTELDRFCKKIGANGRYVNIAALLIRFTLFHFSRVRKT
jgi:hypothetical protein